MMDSVWLRATSRGDVVRSPSAGGASPATPTVRRGALVWLVCSVLGAVVIALPDSNQRVFSLSAAHGPSVVDLLGVLVMLAGWALFVRALWLAWRQAGRTRTPAGIPLVTGLGLGLLVASVTDYPHWWLFGAILLAAAQLAFAYFIPRARPDQSNN